MNTAVIVFYRQLIATLLLVPVALWWKGARWLYLVMLLAVTELYCEISFVVGRSFHIDDDCENTSSTIGLICNNRTEKVKVKRHSGIAKLCGVGLCIAGALTIAFYRGPRLNHLNRHHVLAGGNQPQVHPHPYSRWVLGTFLMIVSNLTCSLFSPSLSLSLSMCRVLYLIFNLTQEPLLKQYPSELMFTTLQSLFSAIQTLFTALAIERDFSRWKLRLDMGLISVAYCVRDSIVSQRVHPRVLKLTQILTHTMLDRASSSPDSRSSCSRGRYRDEALFSWPYLLH
ncbi:hypothetical protein B296_00025066 [Ensete ventricosum]|uniref:Uncharacterized protein n=1 Tax=Ensete ventricosum TaxID=4639 RepID=A0A426ZG02_ENSVE|nr:hypothetical protein B296_00025066 [Ensete ventricosum]